MNYEKQLEFLKQIKINYYDMTLKQRTFIFFQIISEHPDSLSILYNMNLIDKDFITACIQKGLTGYSLSQALIDSIEIKTTSSDELSLTLFGYIRTITPAELNDYIDDVVTSITEQIQYLEYQNKGVTIEQELALDEIEEFTK